MSKEWSKFKKKPESAEETSAFPTMNLRVVVSGSSQVIEQMYEHRTAKGVIVETEWVAIPVIYSQG
nr:MAG TPA: hypothetical protein [Caudoviricetes sp.]